MPVFQGKAAPIFYQLKIGQRRIPPIIIFSSAPKVFYAAGIGVESPETRWRRGLAADSPVTELLFAGMAAAQNLPISLIQFLNPPLHFLLLQSE